MSKKQLIVKKGASAIYMVIFTATLLSIIALSFVRLMLSEMNRTTNYSLSQSAYNSALAGIEDAKIVLLRYQNCMNTRSYDAYGNVSYNYKVNGNPVDCPTLADAFTTNVSKTAEDCDAVSKLLGHNTSNHETIIQTVQQENGNQDVTDSAKSFDQAYTCVKVSAKNRNYLTTLAKKYPTKIVPIRTINDAATDSVNRVVISWFSRKNLSDVSNSTTGAIRTGYHSYKLNNASNPLMNGAIKRNNIFQSSIDDYKNTFNNKPTVPSTIQATLIQTAKTFRLSEFYASKYQNATYRTNRGTITLRPTTENLYGIDADISGAEIRNYSNHISGTTECGSVGNEDCYSFHGGPFATAATKSQNTPLDVYCYTSDGINTPNGYACTADIYVPKPINYSSSNKRNYTTFFLVLNLPYGEPDTEVSVELKSCKRNTDSIYTDSDDGCKSVDFANVQPIVDSTGRANDLFRRVEARVELIDTYYPIVSYALSVDGTGDDEGNVEKDFYVTTDCSYSETTWNATAGSVSTSSGECNNSGRR